MKRLLAFAAAVALAYLAARGVLRPPALVTADLDAPSRRAVEERSPTALPDAGQPWSPPVEKGNVRVLKVAEVPAPGRARTPEERAQAAAIDAAAREPLIPAGGVPGVGYGGGSAPSYRAANLDSGRAPEPDSASARSESEELREEPRAKGAKPPARGAPPAATDEGTWMGQTKGLVEAAKSLGAGGAGAETGAGKALLTTISNRMYSDAKAAAGVRNALSNLAKSGKPMTQDAVEEAVAESLRAQGQPAEPEDVQAMVAMAHTPAMPPPSPQATAAAAAELAHNLPNEQQLVEINRRALAEERNRPTAPTGPPPKGAAQAYDMFKSSLEKAERDFGVKPHHLLGLLYIETRWGANIGKLTARDVAYGRSVNPSLSPATRRDAERQLAALMTLRQNGELGGYSLDKAPSNGWVAMGPSQFIPASVVAYWRSPDGSPRNPYDRMQAPYATANYLAKHNYARDVPRSIYGYNHSQEYVRDVLRVADQIKAVIPGNQPPAK